METPLDKTALKNQWERVGMRHHHGICLPLFCIHSQQSAGIGEFSDLLPLLEWCQLLGLDTLHVQNIWDSDESPLSPSSAFALNPIYLNLHKLPGFGKKVELRDQAGDLQVHTLNEVIPFKEIRQKKLAILRKYFEEESEQITSDKDFQFYCVESPWLNNYALFNVLNKKNEGKPTAEWSREESSPTPEEKIALHKEHEVEITFYKFVQFACDTQLAEVKKRATKLKMFLKGDIPLSFASQSSVAWGLPHLFSPEINWKGMEEDGFRWWKDRLDTVSAYFHLCQLENIETAFPKDHGFKEGREVLSTFTERKDLLPMLPDLELAPREIKDCARELGICASQHLSNKRPVPKDLPIQSLSTVVHSDLEGLSKEELQGVLWKVHHSPSLFHITPLVEYLNLFQDLLWVKQSQEDTALKRLHPSIEELIAHPGLNQCLHSLLY